MRQHPLPAQNPKYLLTVSKPTQKVPRIRQPYRPTGYRIPLETRGSLCSRRVGHICRLTWVLSLIKTNQRDRLYDSR